MRGRPRLSNSKAGPRAQARNRAAPRRHPAIWKRLIADSRGFFRIELIRLDGALPSPPVAHAITNWMLAIAAGELVDPLCIGCDSHPGRRPSAFVVLLPHIDNPGALSVTGVCQRCAARSDEALIEAAVARLKKDRFNDLRPLPAMHMQPGGRA